MTEIQLSDLEKIQPQLVETKVDDKAAVLEAQLADIKAGQAKERALFTFVVSLLFCVLVGFIAPNAAVTWIAVLGMLLLNIAIGTIVGSSIFTSLLLSWHSRLEQAWDVRVLGKRDNEFEE